MIRKIKAYFKHKRERRLLQLEMQREVLETLCTVCMYLERDGHFGHNPHAVHMRNHYKKLSSLSERIRKNIVDIEAKA